ncbi:PaaI family thioesterase [Hyphomicrobium sp.]|uniref:PaaI family thioesterase n=1 Tax=Hyphomicrobium sp. TaxID=82 RepID=UPI000FAD363F|nr:PaaI family thioesterase [Hyphomicrobium sp.]RUO98792.1 MAG: PaaI family thioesterase [Hyphomicrobium sp.]
MREDEGLVQPGGENPEGHAIIDVATMASMSGLDYLRAMIRRELPRMPIETTLGFEIVEADEGRSVFISTPGVGHYNAIGTVHAGYTATLLDSCMACAVLSTLPKGTGFTTMEFKISLLRPMTKDTGPVRAEGTMLSRGRRGAVAEGKLTDSRGKLMAHATTTCLIFSF